MGKKSNIINPNFKAKEFNEYLKIKIGNSNYLFLEEMSSFSEVFIFSGIIRNFFIGYEGEIRDLDLVINCDEKSLQQFLLDKKYEKNSFGGYKIFINDLTIDIWHIERTWAFTFSKVDYQLFLEYNLPNTVFFNFSSIIFDFNNQYFIFNSDFQRFIKTKEIDIVLEDNPAPALCIINTIYYKDKYKLKISKKLKNYYLKVFGRYKEKDYLDIQIKHFKEVKYKYQDLEKYKRKFEQQLIKVNPEKKV